MRVANTLLNCLVIAVSISCTSQVHADLIGHWTFDEGTGTTIADSAGGKEGIYSEGANSPGFSPTWIAGRIGSGAMKFNGTNQWVNVPESVGPPGMPTDVALNQTSYTIAFWARPDDLSASDQPQRLVSKDNGTSDCAGWDTNFSPRADVGPGVWNIGVQCGEGFICHNFAHEGGVPTQGTWDHWAFTYNMNAELHTTYKNGSMVGVQGGIPPIGTIPFVSNAEYNLTFAALAGTDHLPIAGQYFDGALDDIRIYNEVVAEPDIFCLANPELCGISGDYNDDGSVGAADYVVWRKLLGTSTVLPGENPDAMTPGLVDQEDFEFWTSRFGVTSSSGTGAVGDVAVPEPCSSLLGMIGVLFGATVLRFSRSRSLLPDVGIRF